MMTKLVAAGSPKKCGVVPPSLSEPVGVIALDAR